MARPIRLVIADDHELYRDGFRLLLKRQEEVELVGEAENGKELLEKVAELQPDVVITDIKMPVMDGIEACKLIRKRFSDVKVIALSMFDDDHLVVDMLEAGARGYLLKNTHKQELMQATKSVFSGNTYYCKATSTQLTRMLVESKFNPYRGQPVKKFTGRETEIIKLIARQFSNKEIADLLKISMRTVESHREKIYEKTGALNPVGIVIYAIKNNIVQI